MYQQEEPPSQFSSTLSPPIKLPYLLPQALEWKNICCFVMWRSLRRCWSTIGPFPLPLWFPILIATPTNHFGVREGCGLWGPTSGRKIMGTRMTYWSVWRSCGCVRQELHDSPFSFDLGGLIVWCYNAYSLPDYDEYCLGNNIHITRATSDKTWQLSQVNENVCTFIEVACKCIL